MRSKRSLPRILVVSTAAFAAASVLAPVAVAQVSIDPTSNPTKNTGGWVYGMSVLMFALGAVILLLVVVTYMRFAPRFARERAEGPRTVRAPRPVAGHELPRRAVSVANAPPLVVAPPAIPAAVGAPAQAVAPAPAPAPAPAAAPAPAPAAAPASAPASAPAPTAASAPASAPAPTAASAPAPAPPAAPAAAPAEAASEGATDPAAVSPSPAPAAPAERPEVALDQETFDKTLAELLEKGTDRRVAEGQAKRAAMIAARKKAGG